MSHTCWNFCPGVYIRNRKLHSVAHTTVNKLKVYLCISIWAVHIIFTLFTGNTALTYACAGGFIDVVKVLLKEGANIEDHNENGHTPLMEAASAGHVEVARVLLEYGAGINTHSNEFKESALTLACYKGQSSVALLPYYFNITLGPLFKGK